MSIIVFTTNHGTTPVKSISVKFAVVGASPFTKRLYLTSCRVTLNNRTEDVFELVDNQFIRFKDQAFNFAKNVLVFNKNNLPLPLAVAIEDLAIQASKYKITICHQDCHFNPTDYSGISGGMELTMPGSVTLLPTVKRKFLRL